MEPRCRRCLINPVPHPKYLCLSCICVVDGCVNRAGVASTVCVDHQCLDCSKISGVPYISASGRLHVMPNNMNTEEIQLYADYDICLNDWRRGAVDIKQCQFKVHCFVCTKYNNAYPSGRYDKRDGFETCAKLNSCTVTNCTRNALNDGFDTTLMRCSYHYTKCLVCDRRLLFDNAFSKVPDHIKCDRCVALTLDGIAPDDF